MAVTVPVTALVMWFSTAVVRLLYQGGQFDEAATIFSTPASAAARKRLRAPSAIEENAARGSCAQRVTRIAA